jgi:hypothetical protein
MLLQESAGSNELRNLTKTPVPIELLYISNMALGFLHAFNLHNNHVILVFVLQQGDGVREN